MENTRSMERFCPSVEGHMQVVISDYERVVERGGGQSVEIKQDEKTVKRRARLCTSRVEQQAGKPVDDEWSDFEPYVDAWMKGPTKQEIRGRIKKQD